MAWSNSTVMSGRSDRMERMGWAISGADNPARTIRRGQSGGGNLVEQWLKQMVIGAVHHRHLRAGMMEMFAKRQAAKARAEHDHPL